MRSSVFILAGALCLGSVGCLAPASRAQAGDKAIMDRYAASYAERRQIKLEGFRWPNGKGYKDEEKVVEITQVDARTTAFGKREIKCRLTIEIKTWEVINGTKTGSPKVSRKTEERWLPAE